MTVDVGRGEVHGVPVFWGTAPGDAWGALLVRVGHSDEALPRRGVTHLVEHLALHPFDRHADQIDGLVDLTTTVFHCQGSPEQVATRLTRLARSLAELPYARADDEAQTLRAEAARRRPSTAGTALARRYGPFGLGATDYEELFLHQSNSSTLEHWHQKYFTRQNSAVVLSCAPPSTLDLSALPDGNRFPVGVFVPLDRLYPAFTHANSSSVACSFVVTRSAAARATLDVLTAVLHRHLRDQLSLSNRVGSTSQVLSATHEHHVLYAECRPDDAREVMGRMQTELARIAIDGCPADVLDQHRRLLIRAQQQLDAGMAAANHVATEWLLRGEVIDLAAADAELAALVPADVQRNVRDVLDTALWIAPDDVEVPDLRLHHIAHWSSHSVTGRQYPATPAATDLQGQYVVTSSEGISLAVPGRGYVTVMFDRVAACKGWADGARTLYGSDGFTLTIHPDDWTAGADVVTLIDRQVPAQFAVRSTDRLRPAA